MRRVLFIIFCLLLFVVNKTIAYNLHYFSDDERIISALEVLESNGCYEVLNNLVDNGVKIRFYDISVMDPAYSESYAISSVDQMSNRYILINKKYMYSPKEALACLIAHESFHKRRVATFEEEVKCTQKEAEYWHRLKSQLPQFYVRNQYVDRLDRLEALYLNSDKDHDRIAESIQHSEFYANQLVMN